MSLLRDLTLVCGDLRRVVDHVMQNTLTASGLRRCFNDCNFEWLHHLQLHCHVDFPSTYVMSSSAGTADAINHLLHVCGLSTLNEQLLIKVI